MAKAIYRGPVEREPETINVPVTGALVPGVCVVRTGANLTAAANAAGRLFMLSNRRFYDQDVNTAYVSGDTAVAYRLEIEQEYQAQLVAGSYTRGQALSVGAGGVLKAAVTGDVVAFYFDEPDRTLAAQGFADVVVGQARVVPA